MNLARIPKRKSAKMRAYFEATARRFSIRMLITVIGRGHSGTRAISNTLAESGVYMGAPLNPSWDLVPATDMYEACRIVARHVVHLGGANWDFSALNAAAIDPAFTRLVESYLASVLTSDAEHKGWKLPETTLALPWIVRLFPDIHYIYWLRDPRDSITGQHVTDDLDRFCIPHEETDDVRLRRAISWKYQYDLMRSTPMPRNRIELRFEDFVLHQGAALDALQEFLGFPLATIPVRTDPIGRWRIDPERNDFDFFPREALYNSDEASNEILLESSTQ
jgi:hypothetical protein